MGMRLCDIAEWLNYYTLPKSRARAHWGLGMNEKHPESISETTQPDQEQTKDTPKREKRNGRGKGGGGPIEMDHSLEQK